MNGYEFAARMFAELSKEGTLDNKYHNAKMFYNGTDFKVYAEKICEEYDTGRHYCRINPMDEFECPEDGFIGFFEAFYEVE